MLDIPNAPLLDKRALIGGCVRLSLAVDAEALAAEVAALPASVWGSRGGRVGPHDAAEAIFLRGFAPAEGSKPVEDRPALDSLPYLRSIIETLIPAPPLRCLLARLPPGAIIVPHVDLPPYFGKTLRVHVPVESNDQVHMMAAGLSYRMRPGEVWVLNNSATHAVWNAHPSATRTHMICDFLPSAELRELLRTGDRELGEHAPEVERHLDDFKRARTMAGR
jgi:hypothetical protein